MDELRELYQEMILDHYKNPRNRIELKTANHRAEGYNPLCGDRVTIYLRLDDGRVKDISFTGSGCAICTASSSIMTESFKDMTLEETESLFAQFHNLVTSDPASPIDTEVMGKLAIFGGVREYPIRIKCATLPWHTFQAALQDENETVSTE